MKAFLSILAVLTAVDGFAPSAPLSRVERSSQSSLSMALTLYGSPGSRSPLCNWAALELKLPLEAGDLSKNPHPFGQIPVRLFKCFVSVVDYENTT